MYFVITGSRAVLPAKSLRFVLGREVEVWIGRPIDASAYSRTTRDALMAAVEREIRTLADLPT